MRINGTINEWNVLNQEFKLLTMTGEYTIGTDTREKLKEIIDRHNRRMEGRE